MEATYNISDCHLHIRKMIFSQAQDLLAELIFSPYVVLPPAGRSVKSQLHEQILYWN